MPTWLDVGGSPRRVLLFKLPTVWASGRVDRILLSRAMRGAPPTWHKVYMWLSVAWQNDHDTVSIEERSIWTEIGRPRTLLPDERI